MKVPLIFWFLRKAFNSISYLPDNFMNNKTNQRLKIIILSRLLYNPKKQDNS